MNDTTRRGLGAAAALALLLAAPARAAQEGEPERPLLTDELRRQQSAQEIVELFSEVESKLNEIDEMLWSASAGERPLEAPEDAGIGDLLENARRRGGEVRQDIERILEIAQQQGGGGGGGGGQMWSPGQQGSSPDAKQESETEGAPGERLATPEMPDSEQPGGEKPEEQKGEKPGGEKPEEDGKPAGEGDQPTSPFDSPGADDQNRAGQLPEVDGVEAVPRGQEADRWGELPLRVREVFRAEGGGDLPARYRDWIDAYYRRLNRRR